MELSYRCNWYVIYQCSSNINEYSYINVYNIIMKTKHVSFVANCMWFKNDPKTVNAIIVNKEKIVSFIKFDNGEKIFDKPFKLKIYFVRGYRLLDFLKVIPFYRNPWEFWRKLRQIGSLICRNIVDCFSVTC